MGLFACFFFRPYPRGRGADVAAAAFKVITATLTSDAALLPPQRNAKGDYLSVEARWLKVLGPLRGPGESYSDAILRLAEAERSLHG